MVILVLIGIGIGVYFVAFNKEDKVAIVGESVMTLSTYGEKYYDDKSYLTFEEFENGIHYISYKRLKDMGFDVDKYVVNCKNDDAIIIYDESLKNDREYPISVVYDCDEYNKR